MRWSEADRQTMSREAYINIVSEQTGGNHMIQSQSFGANIYVNPLVPLMILNGLLQIGSESHIVYLYKLGGSAVNDRKKWNLIVLNSIGTFPCVQTIIGQSICSCYFPVPSSVIIFPHLAARNSLWWKEYGCQYMRFLYFSHFQLFLAACRAWFLKFLAEEARERTNTRWAPSCLVFSTNISSNNVCSFTFPFLLVHTYYVRMCLSFTL